MFRTVVATAGHVDHGKTRLIEALTGIDCDRWQEEKDRGITIDLGFAHLVRDDVQLGFVDVPGHERFVHNAVAGLGGIGVMLLVVAADEGVKPQTREHVAICELLGIERAVAALTKIDLVGDDLRELAELEVAELLATTPWPDAPILPVSSIDGQGVADLERALLAAARENGPAGEQAPTRLPVDRAFHLKGLGAVVTGSLVSGRIRVQDELELLPRGETLRIRSLQVHGSERETALPGERVAAQLAGVSLEALERGGQLVTPGTFGAGNRLLARGRLLSGSDSLAGWREIRLHLYAQETVGKARAVDPVPLEPGVEGLLELRTREPVVAARGDRFVLRRPSPVATLGGGEVLDPIWIRLPVRLRASYAHRLAGDREDALQAWIELAGEGGATTRDLARRLGEWPEALEGELAPLTGAGKLLRTPGKGGEDRWIGPAVVERVAARARRVLERYFRENRLADSLPKAEAGRRILRGRGRELTDTWLRWLEAAGVLEVRADEVALPGRSAQLTTEESRLTTEIRRRYEEEGLTPSSPAEIARGLGAKPQIFEGLLGYLLDRGDLIRLPGGLLLSRKAFDDLAGNVRSAGWERFSVADFKDRFGLSRKWAIPLLERLDSEGVTRRVGDERMVVGR